LIVLSIEVDDAVERRNPPLAVLADVFVLVGRLAPAAFLTEPAYHHQRTPAPFGRASLAVDVQHGLQLHVIVERAVTIGREPMKIAAHPLSPDVDAAAGDLEGASAREKVRCLVPQALVDIVAVGALEV